MTPRFSVDRRTGEVTFHKPFTADEIKSVQAAVIIKHTELHPEVFEEDNK